MTLEKALRVADIKMSDMTIVKKAKEGREQTKYVQKHWKDIYKTLINLIGEQKYFSNDILDIEVEVEPNQSLCYEGTTTIVVMVNHMEYKGIIDSRCSYNSNWKSFVFRMRIEDDGTYCFEN